MYFQDKLPPIGERGGDDGSGGREKFVARNWKKKDTKKMSQAEKSRYLAVSIIDVKF